MQRASDMRLRCRAIAFERATGSLEQPCGDDIQTAFGYWRLTGEFHRGPRSHLTTGVAYGWLLSGVLIKNVMSGVHIPS